MPSGFQYRPVAAARKEIRVLTVEPGNRADNDILECSIDHVQLADDPESGVKYETISYAWGEASLRSQIHVDGNVLDVPRSSDMALRRMRLSDRKRTLWTDAVCINQKDLLERSQQVAFMAEIYRRGTGNLIYLGEAGSHVGAALKSIETLMETEIAEAISGDRSLLQTVFTSGAKIVHPNTGFSVSIDQKALELFFGAAWFERLWVLQEAASSLTNRCHCGRFEFELLDVLMVALWLTYKCSYVECDTRPITNAFTVLSVMRTKHSLFAVHREEVSVYTLLQIPRGLRCSESKDHVFAVLGLKDWSAVGGIPEALVPNYHASLADVFTRATFYAIAETKTFGGYFVQHRSYDDVHFDGLPSWVPRWHREYYGEMDAFDVWRHLRAPSGFSAECQLIEARAQSAEYHKYVTKGLIVDNVEQVHLTTEPWEGWQWEDFQASYYQPLQRDTSHEESFTEIAASVLTTRCWIDREAFETCHIATCKTFFDILESGNDLPPLRHELPLDATQEQKALAECRQVLTRACYLRSVGRTEQHRPALVPYYTEPGDVIAIIYGSLEPFVLRPCGDDFEVLGKAYVHGLMDGEALGLCEENGSQPQRISLI